MGMLPVLHNNGVRFHIKCPLLVMSCESSHIILYLFLILKSHTSHSNIHKPSISILLSTPAALVKHLLLSVDQSIFFPANSIGFTC